MALGKARWQVADASLRQAVRQVAVPLSQSRRQAMEAARVAKDIIDNEQGAAPARPGLVARERAMGLASGFDLALALRPR